MPKTKFLKILDNGQDTRAVCYALAHSPKANHVRGPKKKLSSEARLKIDARYSYEKLSDLLAYHFSDCPAYFLTLTYDDAHLPANREAAIKNMSDRYFPRIRKHRKAHGQAKLKYVYCTEDRHGDARLHHHVILNGGGPDDLEVLESLWSFGFIDIKRYDPARYEEVARYMTKEAHAPGYKTGAHSWTPSRGLKRPTPVSTRVDAGYKLELPTGAIEIDHDHKDNVFGEYHYLRYTLPDAHKLPHSERKIAGL